MGRQKESHGDTQHHPASCWCRPLTEGPPGSWLAAAPMEIESHSLSEW